MTSQTPTSPSPLQLQNLSSLSAIPPPAGVESNFLNPQNKSVPFYIEGTILLAIAIVFLANRGYFKAFILKKYTWDDLTLFLAALGSFVFYGICIWSIKNTKVGIHMWDIRAEEAISDEFLLPFIPIVVLAPFTMLFVKITFFIMYLQFFGPLPWVRACAWCGIVFTTILYAILTIYQMVLNIPAPGQSIRTIQSATQQQTTLILSMLQASGGLVIDLWILVLPLFAVSKLQLPKRKKIGVMLIFFTGSFACISSLLSIYYRSILNTSIDVTWEVVAVLIVTVTEMFIGIICACMPAAAHSFRHFAPLLKNLGFRFRTYIWTLYSPSHTQDTENVSIPHPHPGSATRLVDSSADSKLRTLETGQWMHLQRFGEKKKSNANYGGYVEVRNGSRGHDIRHEDMVFELSEREFAHV